MKKIALSFVLILTVTALSAQSMDIQTFRLGLKASPSLAWLKPNTEDYEREGLRLGFSYGLLAEFLMAEQYGFATGVHISYMGGKLSFPIEEVVDNQIFREKERLYKLQHLEIPFTLKMKTREIGYNTYYAKFGFGGAINIKSTADDRFYAQDGSSFSRNDIDIKNEIPLMRVSMILGAGTEYSLGGNTSLVGGITFNNGFTNILKGEDSLSQRKKNARANYLEITLGILF
jgi:hypothetical protein